MKGYATGSVSVGRLGAESMEYGRSQWNDLIAMTEGTELEGLYKRFGEPGYTVTGRRGGQFASPEAAQQVKEILGSAPTLDKAVHQYYGHYSPGGSGMAGRYMVSPPQPVAIHKDASAETVAEARAIQAQLEQEHWSPAGQKGQSGWVQIPEQTTRVTATPTGVEVQGAVTTAEYIGSPLHGGAETLTRVMSKGK